MKVYRNHLLKIPNFSQVHGHRVFFEEYGSGAEVSATRFFGKLMNSGDGLATGIIQWHHMFGGKKSNLMLKWMVNFRDFLVIKVHEVSVGVIFFDPCGNHFWGDLLFLQRTSKWREMMSPRRWAVFHFHDCWRKDIHPPKFNSLGYTTSEKGPFL